MTLFEAKVVPLVREQIRSLVAYSSARKENESTVPQIHLDANERPFGEWCRYPDPQPAVLTRALASLYSRETAVPIDPQGVLVARGSDEAIDVIVRTFCEARQDSVLITSPTYGMYKVSADIQGVAVHNVPLLVSETRGFEVDTAGVIAAACDPSKHIKLVFLCSPNNPTGQLLDRAAVKQIAEGVLGHAMVVVDEAYVEFSAPGSTLLTELATHPNLIVTRTLSKAFGMASVRLGCAIAAPQLVQGFFCKVIAPYPIPGPVVAEVVKVLTPEAIERTMRETAELVARRNWLSSELAKVPCVLHVYPADSNFILFKVRDAAEAMRITKAQGVVLRDRSKDYGLANHLRITTGTQQETEAALNALRSVPIQQS